MASEMPVLPEVGSRMVIPGPMAPFSSGVLDQRARDTVLDRARRVLGFELGPDAHAGLGRQASQLDERRVAYGLYEVAVATAARLVLEWGDGHFRKCSYSFSPGRGACAP